MMTRRQQIAFDNPCRRPAQMLMPCFRHQDEFGRSTLLTVSADGTNPLRWHVSLMYRPKGFALDVKHWTIRTVEEGRALLFKLLEGVGRDSTFVIQRFGFHLRKDLTTDEEVKIVKTAPFNAYTESGGEDFCDFLSGPYYELENDDLRVVYRGLPERRHAPDPRVGWLRSSAEPAYEDQLRDWPIR